MLSDVSSNNNNSSKNRTVLSSVEVPLVVEQCTARYYRYRYRTQHRQPQQRLHCSHLGVVLQRPPTRISTMIFTTTSITLLLFLLLCIEVTGWCIPSSSSSLSSVLFASSTSSWSSPLPPAAAKTTSRRRRRQRTSTTFHTQHFRLDNNVDPTRTTRLHQSTNSNNDEDDDDDEKAATTTTTTPTSTQPDMEEVEESLSDVDTRVLRALLQEQKFDMNNEDELRKLLERGTVKRTPTQYRPETNDNNDDSLYSSKVIQTLTDTKLWKKLSVQANDMMESVGIWVTNKVEQDVRVLAALGLFAWDRVKLDVARALPPVGTTTATTTSNIQKQISLFLLTNTSSVAAEDETDTRSTGNKEFYPGRNIREEMNRPEDEVKSVSRELFAILSGERTNYGRTNPKNSATSISSTTIRTQQQQQQRGLRTVAPGGTVYSGERQRRALQQKKKIEQSKKNMVTNLGIPTVVDSVWELRQEMKSESNVPGYKTEPIRNVIAASVSATNNLLQSVREQARLVAAATVRPKDELLLLDDQISVPVVVGTINGINTTTETETIIKDSDNVIISNERTIPTERDVRVDPMMNPLELQLWNEIRKERVRIMNQLTICIDEPMISWLIPEIVDTFDTIDFISSTGMQNSITKMILLRDEIQKNYQLSLPSQQFAPTTTLQDETTTTDLPVTRSSFDAAVNDLMAIRTAIEYLYTCTLQDVSDVIAEEIRYYILFNENTDNNDVVVTTTDSTDNIPLILRLEDELLKLQQQTEKEEEDEDNVVVVDSKNVFVVVTNDNIKSSSPTVTTTTTTTATTATAAVVVPDVMDVIPDAILIDIVPKVTQQLSMDDIYVDGYADIATTGYVTEIVSEDEFDNAVGVGSSGSSNNSGNSFKQVYNINDEENELLSDEQNNSPNILIVVVLRSIDVLLFVVEKVVIVGLPGTITIVTNVVTRVDEMNQFGLGSKGWKELNHIAKAKGRY